MHTPKRITSLHDTSPSDNLVCELPYQFMINFYKNIIRAYSSVRIVMLAALAVLLLLSSNLKAQYANVPVTGFNSDQVANGVGVPTSSSTAAADGGVDNGGYTFVDGTYAYNATCTPPTANILPANNQISSTAAPGLIYVLQSYSGNNALRVPASGVLAGNATFTVTTPVSAATLYLLCVSGGGAITSGVTVTVTFTDNSTQTFVNQSTQDWCNTTSSGNYTKITTTQYNRIQATTATGCTGIATCQYFAEMALNIDGANYGKQIASINVSKTTATNVMNVYAVGIKAPCSVPVAQPTSLSAGTATTSSVSGTFVDASTAPSGYLVVRYPNGATTITAPVSGVTYTAGQSLGAGTVVAAGTATTFTASGLSGGTAYDFYIYSYNTGATCGGPVYYTTSPLTGTLSTNACGSSISGTVPVGPGNTYTNITLAMAAINAGGLNGHTVLELQSGYDASTETYPLVFPLNPCVGSNKTLTIRPASGVSSPLIITSSNTTATIDFNGATYVTIDGRPGGIGTTSMLTIINTSSTGVAARFTNDASFNKITYCDVQGENTSATSSAACAVIYFGTANATTLNGNDSNQITYCNVHATATGFPAIAIASYGNNVTSPVTAWNDYNVISNCNIYDFFSATLASTGIKLDGGSNAFTIANNRLFQTATRTYTTGNQHRAFWLTPTTTGACGYQVLNNFIGGNDAAGNGTWTLAGNVATNFWGMDINHTGTVHTSVQGNTITRISLTSTTTTANDLFRGISTGNIGHVDIGNIQGNTIGSATVNGAITLSTTGTGSTSYGIKCASTSASTDSIRVENNTIGGITVSSPTATNGCHLHGIGVTTGSYTFINNNLIGSNFNNNSLYSSNPATSVQSVYGISVIAGIYTTVTNNTVANLTNNYTSTSTATTAFTRGISVTASTTSVVTGNTVKNIASGSSSTGTAGTCPLTGISVNTANPSTVSGNTVDSLALSHPSTTNATNIDGLYISLNGSAPTHLVTKNFVHHLIVANAANTNAVINGIFINGGSNIVANNMVQLGLKPDGTSLELAAVIRGIYLNTTTATNVYHNTVYIGGTNIGTTAKNTFAFIRGAASGTHDFRNNILVNNRSNATTGGKHYQIFLNTATGLTSSNNVYFGTGTGSVFGSSNNGTSDVASLSGGWIAETGSASANPQFLNPNGTSASGTSPVNLHIDPSVSTAIEGAGTLVASITDDYDGNNRSTNTPVDIGADAGLFLPIGMTIDSTVVYQVTAGMPVGATNQAIVSVRIYANGSVNPLQLTALKLNTSGTTSPIDIASARVYYTGASLTFSTATPFGAAINNPSGTFYASGTQTLAAGLNCFWVAYNISPTATANNFADVRVDSIGLSGNAPAQLLNGDPAGSRKISAPLSGNYNVGTAQTYTSITAAIADMNLLGISGPVTLTLTDATYSAGETFPIVIPKISGASAVNTVTIRPDASVTATITTNAAVPVIRLDSARFVIIDGRQGGVGTTRSLTISNDHASGSALLFINDASFNQMRYTTFRGAATTSTIGVINFSTGLVTGNDSNLIEYCGIGDAATTPATLVQARGSFDATTKFNNGNIISNCDMFNFFNAASESNAFKISKGNTDWRITNNSIYQTVSRTFGSIHYTFNWNRIVDDASNTDDAFAQASLNNMVVTGNYIGGSAPLCGGTPWAETNSAGAFCSYFNVGNAVNTTIKNNTITNFNITSTNTATGAPGVWNAIQYVGGKLDADSNMIGSLTDPNAIQITGGNGGVVFPIAFTANVAGTYSVTGNKISGLKAGGSGTTAINIYNIFFSTAGNTVNYNVDYNDIGNAPVQALASTSTTAQLLMGINNTSSANINMRNNTIHNLINAQSATGTSQTVGIRSTGGLSVITNNTIDSLSNNTAQTGTGVNAAVIGISLTSTNGSSRIERNTIYALNASSATEAVAVTGIYYSGGTNDLINANLIHGIGTVSSSATAQHNGVQIAGGTARVQNNMLRLGIDEAGNSIATSPVITGVNISGGNIRLFFNTVYVGGTATSGTANSFAFNRTSTGTDSLYNNIMVNVRTGGTGNHYVAGMTNNTNAKANHNLYYNAGATVFGLFNNLTQASIVNWKGASVVDGNSSNSNPSFVNPTGAIGAFNLHITGTTPIEGSGLSIAGINDDFDGDVRSSFTPTDIGADAGNFTLSDIFGPNITFTPVTSDTVHAALTLTGFATITDPSNVDVSTNAPRLYYKRKVDNDAFLGNTSLDNGWKYVVSTSTTSPFSFTIDYSLVFGGSVATTDSIQYFIVAQDLLGNVGANPAGGFTAAAVSAVTTAPVSPSFYRIKPAPLRGSYLIGTGQTSPNFVTITDAINTLNLCGVGAPVTFNLTDAAYGAAETFPLTLGNIDGASAVNTITFKPASGITTTITGSNATAIWLLNGADYITIDGSNNGTTSQDLTITNTNAGTSSAVIWGATTASADAATNNTIRNANIVGNATTTTLFGVGFGGNTISNSSTGTANNNNAVINCNIRLAQIGVYSMGNSAAAKNTGTVVSGNTITQLSKAGIYVGFENNINISRNTVRNILQGSNTVYGITLGTLTGNTGTPTGSEVSNATISRNIVDSIVTTAGWSAFGIMVTPTTSGTHNLTNNMVSRVLGGATPNDFVAGVYLGGGGSTNFLYNTIALTGNHTTSRQNFGLAIGGTDPVVDIRNNIIVNNTTGGTVNSYAIGFNSATFANMVCDYNNYVNTGSNAQFAATGGLFNNTNQTTLAALRTATGKDANSKSVTVTFAGTGDLQLTGSSNGDINLKGTAIAGITVDLFGTTRSAQNPYMGAHEAAVPLPVKLVRFTASVLDANVLLNWLTASETNNKGFVLQRSVNGLDFNDVTFIKGKGNTNLTTVYNFTDANAFTLCRSSMLYYRLKQVDLNGQATYSDVVRVESSTTETKVLTVYPNPFADQCSVGIFAARSGKAIITIADLTGQVIRTESIDVEAGNNELRLTNVALLKDGVYLLSVTSDGVTHTKKLIKK